VDTVAPKAYPQIEAHIGFSADGRGEGVAYVRLSGGSADGGALLLRVPFVTKRYPALLDREIGYAALTAVARRLREREIDRVNLLVDDERLVEDLRNRRDVPQALGLAYVRLGCVLNQFRTYEVGCAPAGSSDLTARARAEVAMHVAA